MQLEQVIDILKTNTQPHNLEGMARFGINTNLAYGISMPFLRKLGKQIGCNHALALQLWEQGYRETQILAALTANPAALSAVEMETWMKDFNSWEIVDQVCMNCFKKSELAKQKIPEWCHRPQEFVKRTSYSLMAVLAVHDKQAPDQQFLDWFPLIEWGAEDERNFVKKSVNWALRQIGKRNPALHGKAVSLAQEMSGWPQKSARWIAKDALRELNSDTVRSRLFY